MSQKTIIESSDFHWLDIVNPGPDELEQVSHKYGLPPLAVEACLDPVHLPKFEPIESSGKTAYFVILRAYDESCAYDADTVQELTRKVAFFFGPSFLITIHRKDQPFFNRIREKWSAPERSSKASIHTLLFELISGILGSYEQPIDQALDQLESLEMGVFNASGARPFEIQEGYYLKRKASVFRRMFRSSQELLPKIAEAAKINSTRLQHLKEWADNSYFYCDELMESINGLLNLHISLSSQRTNEVMRVLTIFSVFLLPLNVLTGIYGMNFEHMPELKSQFGYPLVLMAMLVVIGLTYLWFRKKGWMKNV